MFGDTPDDVLADVAGLLRELAAKEGDPVIVQGDLGTTMYVVASGSVRVHNETTTLATLGERAVFGELAAIDPEPRSASVTAQEDTLLLALENGPLLELMGERPEVAIGITRFLCRRVRERA